MYESKINKDLMGIVKVTRCGACVGTCQGTCFGCSGSCDAECADLCRDQVGMTASASDCE